MARRPTDAFRTAFKSHFGLPIQENWFVPKIVCPTCHSALVDLLRGRRNHVAYKRPTIWREPSSSEECYFCTSDLRGAKMQRRRLLSFGVHTTVTAAVPYAADSSEEPQGGSAATPHSMAHDGALAVTGFLDSSALDPTYRPSENVDQAPILITQARLNDLARDLRLPKALSEFLASRLNEWNLLDRDARVCAFRFRSAQIARHFAEDDGICYCVDVAELFAALGQRHNPDKWRLFIDSSIRSLKAVLLHNGNKLPSIPVAYSTRQRETYTCFDKLLHLIRYSSYEWRVVADLKVVAILAGLRSGNVKRACFLCEWDGTGTGLDQYAIKQWPVRAGAVPGQLSVQYKALVPADRILLPPLHIKLGLFSNFIKTLAKQNKDPETLVYAPLAYLRSVFPQLSEAKIRKGVFVGPQIRKLLKDDKQFVASMGRLEERRAWWALRDVCQNFLGKKKAANYSELVAELMSAFDTLGVHMSLKIHFLNSHLERLASGAHSLADVSDEQGERFHQDLAAIEKRYGGLWTAGMMADYCWLQCSDLSANEYRRKRKRARFEPGMGSDGAASAN